MYKVPRLTDRIKSAGRPEHSLNSVQAGSLLELDIEEIMEWMLHEMRVKYEMNIDLNLPQHQLNKEVFTQHTKAHMFLQAIRQYLFPLKIRSYH